MYNTIKYVKRVNTYTIKKTCYVLVAEYKFAIPFLYTRRTKFRLHKQQLKYTYINLETEQV